MLDTFTVETFAPRLGHSFRLEREGHPPLQVELIEANVAGAVESAGPSGRRAPFSIVFRGPARPTLPQRIYRLTHAEVGAFDLFLVPIGPDEVGMRYEAVFT